MKVLKIAVCDDETVMTKEISQHIAAYMLEAGMSAYNVEAFSSGRSLLDSGGDFDLIFLDVRMEGLDGLETAKILRKRCGRSLLIFVTVLKECVFDAFEAEAFDYLLKPLDKGRFYRTMDRAVKALHRQTDKTVVIRRGGAREVVPLSRIVYCEVQGRKIYIHQHENEIIDYYGKLEELEQRLDARFFKCHRSYLINLDYVRSCGAGQAVLSSGDAVPVSRLRERDLARALLRHMKERGG